MANERFGIFEDLVHIAGGGMAEVYRARDPRRRGHVALKRVRKSLATDRTLSTMLLDEARITQRLLHPNIVRTFDAGEVDGEFYLAMELLEGVPWSRLLDEVELPFAIHAFVLSDVLAALDYAHHVKDSAGQPMGIIHRDVSPQNVFVCRDGTVKLLDFGIAKAAGRAFETTTGHLKGKVRYMSPEQARGEPLDARSDLFAVGVMLWESLMAAHGMPARYWGECNEIDVLRKMLLRDLPRSPRALNAAITEAQDAICRRALAYDVDARYRSARELREAVLACARATEDERRARAGLCATLQALLPAVTDASEEPDLGDETRPRPHRRPAAQHDGLAPTELHRPGTRRIDPLVASSYGATSAVAHESAGMTLQPTPSDGRLSAVAVALPVPSASAARWPTWLAGLAAMLLVTVLVAWGVRGASARANFVAPSPSQAANAPTTLPVLASSTALVDLPAAPLPAAGGAPLPATSLVAAGGAASSTALETPPASSPRVAAPRRAPSPRATGAALRLDTGNPYGKPP